MSEDDFLTHIFGVATGWLGWTPDTAWGCTVPEITVAIEAKIDFLNMQNGGPKKPSKTKKPLDTGDFLSDILKLKETKTYG